MAGAAMADFVARIAQALERLAPPPAERVDLDAAEAFVAGHPERQDVRVVVGVTRHGAPYGLARLRNNPDELLAGDDLVPGLGEALSRTLSA